ncbi:peptidoglycan-binding domain-containing protein [Janibacter sp. GS2]|uniref:peptidoglycan-binding domain-containing protein n=1 Tax=Janibacter sp. GS2 TaxID=3442646 RepID=UPI003EB936DB
MRLLQRKLGITADGVFGSGTEAAVKRYQRTKRLGADGIAGPNTLRAMGLYGTASAAKPATSKPKPTAKPKPTTKPSSSATVKHTLRRGSPYRSEVRLLQRTLRITADGVFGSGTEAAVKRYQRTKRLGADGIAGPNTLRAMGLR